MFLLATYGEGDPTDNAAEFVDDWLNSDDTDIDEVQFAVFGLGNTEYDQYNAVGKLVDSRMEALGCKRVFKFGMGDDSGDIEDDFNNWIAEGFWNAMRVACGMEPTDEDSSQASAIPERLSAKSEFNLRVLPPGAVIAKKRQNCSSICASSSHSHSSPSRNRGAAAGSEHQIATDDDEDETFLHRAATASGGQPGAPT